jgi:hypothetical protein
MGTPVDIDNADFLGQPDAGTRNRLCRANRPLRIGVS